MELMTITTIIVGTLAIILIVLVKTGKSEAAADLTRRWYSGIVKNSKQLILIGLAVIFTLGFLYFFYPPLSEGIGPIQPIPFSHRVHAGIKAIDCKFCHPYVARSLFPGIPPVEKCLYCHNYIIPQHPWIKKEHKYFNTRTPTPWVKVNYIPEHVLFNHQRHIKKDIACEQCHGKVETMDRLPRNHFKMGFCIECHQTLKAPLDCWLSCHS
jgi:hypothetical protein